MSLTHDELLAFNAELSALAAAGLPLDRGLKEFGRNQSSKLRFATEELAQRLNRGESIHNALAAEADCFPPVYSRIVEAGVRAGKLSSALELVTEHIRNAIALRRQLAYAIIYPTIVLITAYLLFSLLLLEFVVRLDATYHEFNLNRMFFIDIALMLKNSFSYWFWIPPAILVVSILWWILSWRTSGLNSRRVTGPLRLIPGMRKLAANHSHAGFSEMMALLIEHGVPLPEAATLAANSVGDRKLQEAASAMEGHAGKTNDSRIPPFLRWVLSRNQSDRELANALRLASETYRNRALQRAESIQKVFPVVAGVVIAGTTTLFYGLILFVPFQDLMLQLAEPLQ